MFQEGEDVITKPEDLEKHLTQLTVDTTRLEEHMDSRRQTTKPAVPPKISQIQIRQNFTKALSTLADIVSNNDHISVLASTSGDIKVDRAKDLRECATMNYRKLKEVMPLLRRLELDVSLLTTGYDPLVVEP